MQCEWLNVILNLTTKILLLPFIFKKFFVRFLLLKSLILKCISVKPRRHLL